MRNYIHLLPDAIANQIAAGEVVQRPASVVKELLENAIDAGATRIDVFIKNAGKSLIQISDNGSGMSAQDARMCFERHATSKIQAQEDLFGIRTLGFRGEALASIAAVAQVRLRTRLHDAELGVELDIEASEIKRQEPCVVPAGSSFQVKNLFYNVPARRNFLKSNPVETRHIMNEFLRVAIPNPEIHMTFRHNDTEVYDLSPDSCENRLVKIFGSEFSGKLTAVEESAGYARIAGYLGKPEIYRKSRGDQFFFVNNRFIKSNYLNHAIATAYQDFIPKETYPFYAIFIDIDPVHVDINIHPTKTEVKFDDERTLYVLLQGIVRQGLGELTDAPMVDFESDEVKESIYQSKAPARTTLPGITKSPANLPAKQVPDKDAWDQLYKPAPEVSSRSVSPKQEIGQQRLFEQNRRSAAKSGVDEDAFMVHLQGGFILTQREESLLVVHQQLAHQRILFERFLAATAGQQQASQQLLFPQTIEFSATDYLILQEVNELLNQMGFEINEFGRNTLIIYGTPVGIATGKIKDIFQQILADLNKAGTSRVQRQVIEGVAKAVAIKSAVTPTQKLSIIEMRQILTDLFRCAAPAFALNGKPTYKVISQEDLATFFT